MRRRGCGRGPDTGFLAASRLVVGQIHLTALGAPGTTVSFGEVVGGVTTPLAGGTIPRSGALAVRAASWRCDRLVRSFAATATAPDGTVRAATYDLRTPSCANRLAIVSVRHVSRGGLLSVRVVDRWALGDQRVHLCLSGAGVARRCRTVSPPGGREGPTRHVRPSRSGQVRIAAGLAGGKVVRTVAVGAARPVPSHRGPVLLTTGDSTIEGIDSFLGDALGTAARVTSQSFPGTGLSGTGIDAWRGFAREQVRRRRPRVTIVSIGANEGFPMKVASGATVTCCDDAWTRELSRRQRELMQIFARGGAGRVAWLTLPAPRSPERARITAAVDRALTSPLGALRVSISWTWGRSSHRTAAFSSRSGKVGGS